MPQESEKPVLETGWLRLALEIQDACNPVAVANALADMATQMSRSGLDHPTIADHVAFAAVVNKLCHLAGMEQSRLDCFEACRERLQAAGCVPHRHKPERT